jgi:hypothetical protein
MEKSSENLKNWIFFKILVNFGSQIQVFQKKYKWENECENY